MSRFRLKGASIKVINKVFTGIFSTTQTATKGGNGLSYFSPGSSAQQLKSEYGYTSNGVYWIDLPTVGPTQIYCIMDSAIDGGGWMMAFKATRGNTFNYTSKHWTTATTLNFNDLTRNDADAKYHTMNYFQGKDLLALWPDIAQGGSISATGYPWIWLQNNFNDGNRTTIINFFNTVSRKFIGDAKLFSGWASGVFSSQTDVRFYGFNYYNDTNVAKVRWGFGWNENGGGLYPNGNMGSDDVTGGIGMNSFWNNVNFYSAGDNIACCQDTTGINRSARVEVYVR
jgi:hypothetical protein